MSMASDLLGLWPRRYQQWQASMIHTINELTDMPNEIRALLTMSTEQSRTWHVAVPEAVEGYVTDSWLELAQKCFKTTMQPTYRREKEPTRLLQDERRTTFGPISGASIVSAWQHRQKALHLGCQPGNS